MANPQKNFGQEKIESGDNTKFLSHAMTIAKWERIDLDSDEEVIKRLDEYFELCMKNDIKPTVSGMANALKISRYTLYDWKDGTNRGKTDNRTEIIAYYYNLLEELYEDYMMNGKVNPVSGIFIGKNHFGYQDKKDIVIQPKSKFDDTITGEDVRNKYLESAVADNLPEIEGTGEIIDSDPQN